MNIFTGLYRLITSPSGVFSLLSLAILTVLSWKLGIAWATAAGMAWAAFFAIIPASLGYFEHKERLVQWQQPTNPYPLPPVPGGPVIPPPPSIQVVLDPTASQSPSPTSTSSMLEANLPPRGTL